MKDSQWNPDGEYDSPIKDLPEFRVRTLRVGGPDAVAVTDDAVAWTQRWGGRPVLGRGRVRGPLYLTIHDRYGEPVKVLAIDTDGGISVNYVHMDGHAPYSDVDERLRLNHLLNEIDRISIDDSYAVRRSWPKIGLDALRHEATRSAFFRVFDGVAARLSGASTIPRR